MHIIGGKFKKKPLIAPKSDAVRPTTSQLRETVFNICQLAIEKADFLDLFAGSGAMGLEAISRGASYATFVEQSRDALHVIKQNIENLHIRPQISIMGMDVFKALQRLKEEGRTFDIIYADPPYGKGLGKALLEWLDQHPLLNENGLLFIEEADLIIPHLHVLEMQRQRKVGRASLSEFRKK
jgi:16S rRNA (guanine966-N2)-methyltransferase